MAYEKEVRDGACVSCEIGVDCPGVQSDRDDAFVAVFPRQGVGEDNIALNRSMLS